MSKRQFFPLLAAATLVLRLNAGISPVPPYNLGDTASNDVVSPIHLIVIDHERTEKLRREEIQRTPAIFRFYPGIGEDAEMELRSAFGSAREQFFDLLESNYAKRELNEAAVASPRFQRLVSSFQKQIKPFPLSTNLAQLWALGASDLPVQSNLVVRLRSMMGRPIRVDPLAAEGKLGPRQVKMLSLPSKDAAVDLVLAQKEARNFWRTNILVLWKARNELQNSFPPEERALGRFLAGFVKENCVFDAELTRQSRAQRTTALWAADEYQAGQIVIKRGDVIDSRLKAVLDQLRERVPSEHPQIEAPKGQSDPERVVARLRQEEARSEMNAKLSAQIAADQNRWFLIGGVAVSFGFLFVLCVLWWLARRKPLPSLLPAKMRPAQITGTVISCPSCTSTIMVPLEFAGPVPPPVPSSSTAFREGQEVSAEAGGQYWKDRALAAERDLEKRNHVLRAGLLPHLARWFMSKVVRRMAADRKHLMETQEMAEQDLAQLEQRLVSVKAPLEERLKAYEQRIADLEKDLNQKGKENRELIEATIAIARKKLESERSKETAPWN